MATFDSSLGPVVGGKTARAFESGLDIRTVGQLLRHYPRRYEERGTLTHLDDLAAGEEVTVMGEIHSAHSHRMRQRRGWITEVVIGGINSGRGKLTLLFFNQTYRERELLPGRWGMFAGKVVEQRGKRRLHNPDYLLLGGGPPLDSRVQEANEKEADEFAGALIPVYPASPSAALRSWTIARCVKLALAALDPPEDPLPAALRAKYRLVDPVTALRNVHRPEDVPALGAGRTRLKWDEAFVLQVTLAQRRRAAAAHPATARPTRRGGLLDAFDARLPFDLTGGQREVGETLSTELAGEHPMYRLLQGEVGSGKTVCAARAMLQVIDAGGQAALLAPTEVLASQHARSLRELLGPLARAGELDAPEHATRVALLTGSLGARERRTALAEAASGAAGIVVGTHALIQEGVQFADLGLVVVDEQHRFGVEQRDALRGRAERPPHVLVMTATPIPRTVAMTVYGDLETSSLRELPAGRSPITTSVVPAREKPRWLDRAWERVREEVVRGHQAYVVCPRIGDAAADGPDGGPDGGPDDGGQAGRTLFDDVFARRPPVAVLDVAPMLAEGPLEGLRVDVLHGRLPADDKESVMRRFAAGEIDVLVATTVVEVGVDVPNATVMAVLDAERFGVSQLHQLRGRVGRGVAPGLCLLVTDTLPGTPSRTRLDAVASTLDGFELARLDLEQRREGDVLGAAQSGRRSQLRLLSLLRDEKIIAAAREEAVALVDADPELSAHPALAAEVASLVEDERAGYLEKA